MFPFSNLILNFLFLFLVNQNNIFTNLLTFLETQAWVLLFICITELISNLYFS